MVASELTMAFTSIKSALGMVKLISDSRKDANLQERTIELRDVIISIQSSFAELYERYSSLLSENGELKEEITQIHQWESTKSIYDLTKSKFGTYVYAPNESHPNSNPLHYLCTNCYDNRKKSILQVTKRASSTYYMYTCPYCSMKIGFDPITD